MMAGHVFGRHALLSVTLRLSHQSDLTVEFIVDTGFTGFLSLPAATVLALGLSLLNKMPINLADGRTVEVDTHAATILWNGIERDVRVLATGRRPLLGTALLDGYELVAQFTDGGLVTVEDL